MNDRLADIAASQLGVLEESPNAGRQIREYQSATNLDPAPWPWCAAFVCWVVREWLQETPTLSWLSLQTMSPETWRPKTALAYGFMEWSRSRPSTTILLPDSAPPLKGDIVVYDFSHIGIVVRGFGGYIETIEGNTGKDGSRDGDGVYRKIRPQRLARTFIRVKKSSLAPTS